MDREVILEDEESFTFADGELRGHVSGSTCSWRVVSLDGYEQCSSANIQYISSERSLPDGRDYRTDVDEDCNGSSISTV
jgi:hypothetical protein